MNPRCRTWGADKPRAGHESQLAYGSPVFAAGGNPPSTTVLRLSRITPTQQSAPGIQEPVDLRCVRQPGPYGLHDDDTPSLHVYKHDWYCYGRCQSGGSVIDFAARLWDTPPRGRGYLQLRDRLARALL